MTTEEALKTLKADPQNGTAWEVVVLAVYQHQVAYVASLLLTFRVGPAISAPDVVHDVLISFYETWPKTTAVIETEAALNAYLRKSCRNLLVDKTRRNRPAKQLLDFLSVRFSNAFHDSKPDDSIFLNELIDKLPGECGSLMREFVRSDLSPAEIAEKQGVSARKFWSRWYRCIETAKRVYAEILRKKEESDRL